MVPRLLVFLIAATPAWPAAIPVTVDAAAGLKRDGRPYFVKGAGAGSHLDLLAAKGANSLRTWETKDLGALLAEAEKLGLTVSAGIWLEPECSWFSYTNAWHCAKQAERVKREVIKYKDQPALLAWGLGNEVEGDGANAAFWKQLDRLALMVHEADPAHPAFTALAGMTAAKAKALDELTAHLDFIGINTYGGLFSLRKTLAATGWKRPWLLTEWGPQGFWERPASGSGAPLEQTSTEKADMMARGYDEVIHPDNGCLGSYAFVWGAKFEASATWFGLLTPEGETTASVDVLEQRWTGKAPSNRAPSITRIDGAPDKPVSPGATFGVRCTASDPDGDPLTWRWQVLPEKVPQGADGQSPMPAAVKDAVHAEGAEKATVTTPSKPGGYRVYVWVTDGKGHAATANAPFVVK